MQHGGELFARVIVNYSYTTCLQSDLELKANKLALLHVKHLSTEDIPAIGRNLAVCALEVLVVGPRPLVIVEGKLFKKTWLQLKQQAMRKKRRGGEEGGLGEFTYQMH